MIEEHGLPDEFRGQGRHLSLAGESGGVESGPALGREGREEIVQILRSHGFVQRHAHVPGVLAQVDAALPSPLHDPARAHARGLDGQRVEEDVVDHPMAEPAHALRQHARKVAHPGCDAPQSLRPVIDRVHARHDGEQHLGGADVGGGALAADVLLPCLQRHAQGGVAVGVDGDADDPAGHLAAHVVARGDEGGVRSAVAEGYAEALAVAHRDVGAHLPGGGEQGEREQVGGHDDQASGRVHGVRERPVVAHAAVGARVLKQRAEHVVVECPVARVLHYHLDVERLRPGAHHLDGLRVAVGGDQEAVAAAVAGGRQAERHGLGGRGGLVQQRRVGDRAAREISHHGLEIQKRLQPALSDFRLVGGVLRVPAGVLQDVAENHGRGDGARIAHAQVGAEDLVVRGDFPQPTDELVLGDPFGKIQFAPQADGFGHGVRHQPVEGLVPQLLQHRAHIPGSGTEMSSGESVLVRDVGHYLGDPRSADAVLLTRRCGTRSPRGSSGPRARRRPPRAA